MIGTMSGDLTEFQRWATGNLVENRNRGIFGEWLVGQAAGLEGYVFHELRHTAVAFAIDAGAHPRAIQARLGHASITTTLDVYGHRMPGLDDRLAEALDARLRATLAPL